MATTTLSTLWGLSGSIGSAKMVAKCLFKNYNPPSLIKGKGVRGIGLLNNLLVISEGA
ncbi:MAG: hypothetical protein KAW00_00335 [Dehalococcoidia bacterium]|nr:hypothetical protein [Dehalococcoidia bacterium]